MPPKLKRREIIEHMEKFVNSAKEILNLKDVLNTRKAEQGNHDEDWWAGSLLPDSVSTAVKDLELKKREHEELWNVIAKEYNPSLMEYLEAAAGEARAAAEASAAAPAIPAPAIPAPAIPAPAIPALATPVNQPPAIPERRRPPVALSILVRSSASGARDPAESGPPSNRQSRGIALPTVQEGIPPPHSIISHNIHGGGGKKSNIKKTKKKKYSRRKYNKKSKISRRKTKKIKKKN